MRKKNTIKGGLYLVIDPSMELPNLLDKLKKALEGGVQIVQIFDHWDREINKKHTVDLIATVCHSFHVPVIINNHVELLNDTPVDGIHFDKIPIDYDTLQASLSDDLIIGITCGNDLQVVKWAHENNLDYISFCSMFPSSSVDTCEIVSYNTVEKARELTNIPIFLSGGINLDNLPSLSALDFNGIAVISGIMKASDPQKSSNEYMTSLQNIGIK